MDNMPLRDVTEDEIETYWRDGVVHLPNIIGMAWVERMRMALDRVLDNPGPYGADVNPAGTEGRFTFESFMWVYDDDFKDLALNSPLAPIAAQALRSEKIHHIFDFYFTKEAALAAPDAVASRPIRQPAARPAGRRQLAAA